VTDGLVIHRRSDSASIRSTVPPWRVCKDNEARKPVTSERFQDPKEAQAWITLERAAGRL
jgi:hypothetical protein